MNLKESIMEELAKSDIVWSKYGEDDIEALATRILKVVREGMIDKDFNVPNLDPKGQTAPAASGDKENKTEQNI